MIASSSQSVTLPYQSQQQKRESIPNISVGGGSAVKNDQVKESPLRPLFEIPKMLTSKDVYYLNAQKNSNRRAQSEVESQLALSKQHAAIVDAAMAPGTDTPVMMLNSGKSTASIATI